MVTRCNGLPDQGVLTVLNWLDDVSMRHEIMHQSHPGTLALSLKSVTSGSLSLSPSANVSQRKQANQ